MSNHWSAWQPNHIVHRRAGGRRRYNAQRRLQALMRRLVLVENSDLYSLLMVHGTKARAARFLGVSAATISRDITAIFQGGIGENHRARKGKLDFNHSDVVSKSKKNIQATTLVIKLTPHC